MNLTLENTAIVLDSTSDYPDAPARFPNMRFVPLYVRFGDETFRDYVELGPTEFFEKLRSCGLTLWPPLRAIARCFSASIDANPRREVLPLERSLDLLAISLLLKPLDALSRRGNARASFRLPPRDGA